MKTIEDMKLELLSDNSNKFMQTLIDYDIKSKDKYGSNLLHYYIMNYDSIIHPAGVIISEFIKKGLDINDKRKDGRTALYLSVQCQLQDIFEILLNSNADLDIQNVNGNTPLWEAVMRYRGDGFFIEQLLKNGANPDIKNNYGVSPKSLARTIANYDVRRFFNNDNKQQTD
ncbi:ankyrin repeat domain-containing protein [Bacteroides thetaiotaomicron]|nr:ankyrin repeat domain-containing protein [Bacteroides thetaiotaomicron]